MKKKGLDQHGILLRLILFGATLVTARAQFAVDWYTIDGGGGASTGGVYALTGTIGQPDAGVMSGGPFTLQGGFWSILAAVQTPGAPWLSVMRTATNTVVVSWPNTEGTWRLQFTTGIASGSSWAEIPPPYQTVSTNLFFTEPAPTGNKFYRLQQQ